jgi:hypothetical protein
VQPAYVPPPAPVAAPCNCQAPVQQPSYAPQQDQPATRQMKPANYASAELKKE